MDGFNITVTVYPPFLSPLEMKLVGSVNSKGEYQFYVTGKYLDPSLNSKGYYWRGDVPQKIYLKGQYSKIRLIEY